ncbi:hypothetical protein PHPALM_31721 [Phytophthora palmivora]|uniref:Integrase catalytic domain-containing protein n=1 Tax=Phytophthora palmivora TaxID=4796 RepID=A0A2P4X1W0_9STRA|nr:hypothetical protein PHPALM_31721 [Phytophthora palmivora]
MQVPLGTDLSDTTASAKRVTTRSSRDVSVLRPLQHDDFVWPTDYSIRSVQRSYRAVAPAEEDADGLVRVEGKLWIPSEARELMQRLFVIAHCGIQGHRGGDVMAATLEARFAHVKGGKLVQRQWGPTSTTTTRNECLHKLGESYGSAHYVLVLKDELTHYCELIAADPATSATAVEAVLDWFKRFGLPSTWVSDNGSHFKAAVMAELAERLKAVMLMEMNLDTRNWPYLLPLVQANLIHSVVASLAGHAPVELFTGLPAPSMLDVVAVTDRKERRRAYELARSKGQICNFEVGDFVLWSRVDTRMRGHKLLVHWVGPYRVAQALSHSFIVSHLLTGDELEVHGTRLKHYCDAELGATTEIRERVATQGIILGVQATMAHRFDNAASEWQLHVAWRGLEDTENSWDPFASIYHDVPVLVTQYVQSVDAPELAALL